MQEGGHIGLGANGNIIFPIASTISSPKMYTGSFHALHKNPAKVHSEPDYHVKQLCYNASGIRFRSALPCSNEHNQFCILYRKEGVNLTLMNGISSCRVKKPIQMKALLCKSLNSSILLSSSHLSYFKSSDSAFVAIICITRVSQTNSVFQTLRFHALGLNNYLNRRNKQDNHCVQLKIIHEAEFSLIKLSLL